MRRVVLALLGACLLAGCAAGTQPQGRVVPVSASPSVESLVRSAVSAAPAPAPAAVRRVSPARALPKPKPRNYCAGNTERQLVLVSIARQHVWMCSHASAVYSSGVTTGMLGADTSTPTGHFTIQGKDTNTTLTLNTGAEYAVQYWIPFSAPLYGFHDSSWQRFPYGSPKYRTDGSHGCVHMPLQTMRYLYGWADIGAAVDIRP